MTNNLVRIVTEVSKDCRKQLKILAIQKDITLQQAVKDILERTMLKGSKVKEVIPETIE